MCYDSSMSFSKRLQRSVKPWRAVCYPLPITKRGSKKPPPSGMTRKLRPDESKFPSTREVQEHREKGMNWCGRVRDGYVVLDVDQKPDTPENIKRIQDKFVEKLPDTIHVNSRKICPSNGHYWFRVPPVPEDVKDYARRIGVAVPDKWLPEFSRRLSDPETGEEIGDIVGPSHGYVLMPGSKIFEGSQGKDYRTYKVRVPDHVESMDDVPYLPDYLMSTLIRSPENEREVVENIDLRGYEELTDDERDELNHLLSDLREKAAEALTLLKSAQIGSRDNSHYQVCRDLGKYSGCAEHMGRREDLARSVKIMKKIKDLKSTSNQWSTRDAIAILEKTERHFEEGRADWTMVPNSRLPSDTLKSSVWENKRLRRVLALSIDEDNDMANPFWLLTAMMVYACSTVDHRAHIITKKGKPRPVSILAASYAGSGAGKSLTTTTAQSLVEKMAKDLRYDMPDLYRVRGDRYPARPKRSKKKSSSADRPFEDDTHNIIYEDSCSPIPHGEEMKTANGFLDIMCRFAPAKREKGQRGPSGKVLVRSQPRVVAHYDEPDVFFGYDAERYNLHSIIRKAYLGERLSNRVGRQDGNYSIRKLTYSIQVILNILPAYAQSILSMYDKGTLQRFIIMPADPPSIEEVSQIMGFIDNMGIKRKLWSLPDWSPVSGNRPTSGGDTVSIVFSNEAQGLLRRMGHWLKLSESDYERVAFLFDKDELQRWEAMIPTGVSRVSLGHLKLTVPGAAVGLARLAGIEPKKGRVVIEKKWVEYGMEILRISARTVSSIHETKQRAEKSRRDSEKRTLQENAKIDQAARNTVDKSVSLDEKIENHVVSLVKSKGPVSRRSIKNNMNSWAAVKAVHETEGRSRAQIENEILDRMIANGDIRVNNKGELTI